MKDLTTTLYFVRHGETDYNVRSIVQGHLIDCALNDAGRRQAAVVAERLRSVPFSSIYSSPLRRARETADVISAQHPGVPVGHLAGLSEMSWGVIEGQPFGEQNAALFARFEEAWAAGRFEDRVEGGESIADVRDRALAALTTMLAAGEGGTIGVVTHGRLLRVLLSSILDGFDLTRMDELLHRNTAVSRVTYTHDTFSADLLQDATHLES